MTTTKKPTCLASRILLDLFIPVLVFATLEVGARTFMRRSSWKAGPSFAITS